ncbi:hypothetical protein Tco_1007671, partial [Tanacetum coccineum]
VYLDDDDEEEDENNHSNGNVVKRGITRLSKFRREYGKPNGIKLSVTFDALNRISGSHSVTPRQGGNTRRKQEWISSQHMVSI